jgi:hypothetical protein
VLDAPAPQTTRIISIGSPPCVPAVMLGVVMRDTNSGARRKLLP